MRAAVQQAEELALDVEDRDRALIDGEEFARGETGEFVKVICPTG